MQEITEESKDNETAEGSQPERKNPHRFQEDYDIANRAYKFGKRLSFLWSAIHFLAMILLIWAGFSSGVPGSIFILVGTMSILLSWAIVYCLLSIVTTNALAAKHLVFQSSKNAP